MFIDMLLWTKFQLELLKNFIAKSSDANTGKNEKYPKQDAAFFQQRFERHFGLPQLTHLILSTNRVVECPSTSLVCI